MELELRQQVATLQQDLTAVRRENKKRRKMLEAAQSLMNAGANGYHKVCSQLIKNTVSLIMCGSCNCFVYHFSVLCVQKPLCLMHSFRVTCKEDMVNRSA